MPFPKRYRMSATSTETEITVQNAAQEAAVIESGYIYEVPPNALAGFDTAGVARDYSDLGASSDEQLTARTALGLGTAATHAHGDYATAAQGSTADTALQAADNLSDLANAATARTNLGLGTAATSASTDFATAAQGTLATLFELPVDVSADETTALTTGTAKKTFRMPRAITLTAVRASLTTAQAIGSILTIDLKQAGSSVFSTLLTIDNTELTSTTAVTPPVISNTTLTDDALMTVDITQVDAATAAAGLKLVLLGTRA